MIQRPPPQGNYQLQHNAEVRRILAHAWHIRQTCRRKSARWQAYEALKWQLDRVCGWSSRNPAMQPEDWDAAIRMLVKVLGI